jgi:peptidoglycan/LPS O-acetylase OafA/YrhL
MRFSGRRRNPVDVSILIFRYNTLTMSDALLQHAPEKIGSRWLRPFTRITSSGDYIAEIDGLRFIAIASVVLFHTALFSGELIHQSHGMWNIGQKGVELFFAISGFILAVPFARQYLLRERKVRLKSYFLRRLTRLEPPYLISLILLFLLKLASRETNPDQLVKSLAASSFYMHNWVYGTLSLISGVTWSLEIEVQFYILMPLLAMVFLIRHAIVRRAVLLLAMIGIVFLQPFRLGTPTGYMSLERHIGNYIQFFLAGILLADIYVTTWRSNPSRAAWGDIVWLIGWPALAWLVWRDGPHVPGVFPHTPGTVLFAPIVLLLYLALFKSVIARRLMTIPVIVVIGGMCYSIYLVHNTLILLCGMAIKPLLIGHGFATIMTLCSVLVIPAVLVASAIYFVLIERPCMRKDWPQRLMGMIFIEEKEEVTK